MYKEAEATQDKEEIELLDSRDQMRDEAEESDRLTESECDEIGAPN